MLEPRKCLVIHKSLAQKCRQYLEDAELYDKSRKLRICEESAEIPILSSETDLAEVVSSVFNCGITVVEVQTSHCEQSNKLQQLHNKARDILGDDYDCLHEDLPSTFELYHDLVLFPSNSLRKLGENSEILDSICDVFRVKRIARKNAVVNDKFRSPRTDLLLGSDPWAAKVENKIKLHFNIRKSMFCRGNISEKIRIAKLSCAGEVVVDLFAGIGYFVLPYLVHAKASHVYACEWNPSSVEALEKNLQEAGVSNKCTVLLGDNREVCPKEVADRVNLGLIPSSSMSWRTAVEALKPSGGVLHIHANVEVEAGEEKRVSWNRWSETTSTAILELLNAHKRGNWKTEFRHIECVKSYGPRIYHVVLDLECRKLMVE